MKGQPLVRCQLEAMTEQPAARMARDTDCSPAPIVASEAASNAWAVDEVAYIVAGKLKVYLISI